MVGSRSFRPAVQTESKMHPRPPTERLTTRRARQSNRSWPVSTDPAERSSLRVLGRPESPCSLDKGLAARSTERSHQSRARNTESPNPQPRRDRWERRRQLWTRRIPPRAAAPPRVAEPEMLCQSESRRGHSIRLRRVRFRSPRPIRPAQGLGQFWAMRDGSGGSHGIPGNEQSASCRAPMGMTGSNPTLTAKILKINKIC